MKENDNILSRNPSLSQEIYTILNDCYHSFKEKYGDKHSEYIKFLIESITDKVRKTDLYYDLWYTGPIATANTRGISYTESEKLPAILKHELWHVFNTSENNININPLYYTPKHYITQLEQNGYIRELYEKTMADAKEKWKDEPETLEYVLVDYDTFLQQYNIDDDEIEKWTEWFNSTTNIQDMTDNFWDWGNGFFTKQTSSKSFYDCYINIADMVSCLVPKEKLIEMYLQTESYPTDYSYSQMIDDFDEQYSSSLDEEEKAKYKYPYLKIMMDTKVISDNARTNPELARNALQSCMKTCFNAYFIKLENIQNLDINTAHQLYSEIKYMQEHMLWSIDLSRMLELDSTQAMLRVEDKFRDLLQTLDLENPDVQNMLANIPFTEINVFKFIPGGEKIAQRLNIAESSSKNVVVNMGEYKTSTSENGIKDNLYCSLSTVLGDKKFNLLFENFNGNADNVLAKFYERIEHSSTDEEFISIYNDIYELYATKLETTLKTSENIDILFKRYKTELIQLQENALFNETTQSYPSSLEKVLTIYKEKVQEYQNIIDSITERRVLKDAQRRGISIEDAGDWEKRYANNYKSGLQRGITEIDTKRENVAKRLAVTFSYPNLDGDITHLISEVKISDFNASSNNIRSAEQSNAQTLNANNQQDLESD